MNEYLTHARSVQTVAELIALTRTYFVPETSYYASPEATAFFPAEYSPKTLDAVLRQAGWDINTIEGGNWWCSKGPADTGVPIALEYVRGDLFLRTRADL